MEARQTLADLLAPYRDTATAEAIGCSRQSVHAWRSGKATPDVASLPKLAAFLRVDLSELTLIVAETSAKLKHREAVA